MMEREAEKEHDELHEYARLNFQLYMTWYTFFITTNLVALGLIVSSALDGKLRELWPAFVVAAFFCFQSFMSIQATGAVARMYEEMGERLDALANGVRFGSHTIVFKTYLGALNLINRTLKSMVVLWIAVCLTPFISTLFKTSG